MVVVFVGNKGKDVVVEKLIVGLVVRLVVVLMGVVASVTGSFVEFTGEPVKGNGVIVFAGELDVAVSEYMEVLEGVGLLPGSVAKVAS